MLPGIFADFRFIDPPRRRPHRAGIVGRLGIVGRIFPEARSEEHTSELQSPVHLVCRLLLEKKKHSYQTNTNYDTQYNYLLFVSNYPTTHRIYTLSLHDALPIS